MAQEVRALTKRIESIGKTRKITRAMKLVAASRMRRAGERITLARVYGEKLRAMAQGLAPYAKGGHPLFAVRDEVKTVALVLVTGDRGLCGGFNQLSIRAAQAFMKDRRAKGQDVRLDLVGKKGWEYFKKRHKNVGERIEGAAGKALVAKARGSAERLMQDFSSGAVDEVHIIYSHFISLASQKVTVERLLPAAPPALQMLSGMPPIFEPDAETLFKEIVPRAVAMQVQLAFADSEASEHAARMMAMDNATNNATEIIGRITLLRNKMRQAAVTSEIVEIVSSAEALREA